jgi:large repetitive protein
VKISVLANDSDLDGDSLTVTGVSDPPNGSTVINTDTTVTYDPNGCFVGIDTFSYTISDGNGGTDTGIVSVRMRQASRRSWIGC